MTKVSIRPDATNANKGTERGRYMVETSLRETGAGRSILLDADGRIIAGNKTFEAATDIGLPVRIVETDGTELIAVQRVDLDLSDPTGTARKLAYYDNRASQVGLEWDAEQVLADITAGVDLEAMFRQDELDELLKDLLPKTEGDAEPQIDRAAELNEVWQVKTGDLWQIGEHRLCCGDCTDPAVVAKVMQGEKTQAVVTDPPYGIDYNPDGGNGVAPRGKYEKVIGDKFDFDPTLWLDLEHVVLWGANHYANKLPNCSGWIVWQKIGDGESTDTSDVELAWTNRQCPARRIQYIWRGMIRQGNEDRLHPTQKPIAVMEFCIKHYSGDSKTIFDPFLGSGTTLVACQNLGRRGRGIEVSQNYVAVCLQRMKDAFPGIEITRVSP